MFIQVKGEKLEAIRKLLETQVLFNPIVNAMVSKFTPLEEAKIIRKEDGLMYVYHFGKVTQTDAAILKTRGFRILKTTIDAIEQAGEPIEGETPKHAHALTVYTKAQTTGASFEIGRADKLYIISNGRSPRYRTFLLQKKINGELVDNGFSESKRLNVTPIKFKQPVEVPVIPLGTVEEMKAAIVKLIEPEGELLFPEDIILSTTDFKEGYGYTAKISDLSLVYEGSLSFKVGPVTEGGGDGEEPTEPEIPEEPTEPEDGGETNPPAEVVKEKITAERLVYNDQLLDTVIYSTSKQYLGLNEGEEIQSVVAKDETGVTTASFGHISNFSPDSVQIFMVQLAKTTVNPYLVVTTTERVINIDLTDLSASHLSGLNSPAEFYILDVVGTSFEEVGIPDNSVYVIKSSAVAETATSTEPNYNVALRGFMEAHFAEDIMIDESDPAVATNMSETNIEFEIFLESGEIVTVVTLTPGLE